MLTKWEVQPGDMYHVTGLYYQSKRRFTMTMSSWFAADCIHLWRGSVWLVRFGGKRQLVKRVYN